MKSSFVMYTDYIRQINRLSDEQAGILFRAILNYAAGNDLPEMDPVVAMAFDFIQSRMEQDFEKYERTVEARKAAGKQGGRPKTNGFSEKQTKAKKTNGFSEKQNNPDNDIDYDNDLKEKPSIEGKKKNQTVFVPPTPEDVREYCREKGYRVDAEYLVDFYAKKGWMVGKNKMKDWKAAVRNWVRNDDKFAGNDGISARAGSDRTSAKKATFPQREYDFGELERELLDGESMY